MKIAELLPPERVREIACSVVAEPYSARKGMEAINAAAPELTRAALEWAAKKLEEEGFFDSPDRLRQFTKEIEL